MESSKTNISKENFAHTTTIQAKKKNNMNNTSKSTKIRFIDSEAAFFC